jgi:hypothetical protein
VSNWLSRSDSVPITGTSRAGIALARTSNAGSLAQSGASMSRRRIVASPHQTGLVRPGIGAALARHSTAGSLGTSIASATAGAARALVTGTDMRRLYPKRARALLDLLKVGLGELEQLLALAGALGRDRAVAAHDQSLTGELGLVPALSSVREGCRITRPGSVVIRGY